MAVKSHYIFIIIYIYLCMIFLMYIYWCMPGEIRWIQCFAVDFVSESVSIFLPDFHPFSPLSSCGLQAEALRKLEMPTQEVEVGDSWVSWDIIPSDMKCFQSYVDYVVSSHTKPAVVSGGCWKFSDGIAAISQCIVSKNISRLLGDFNDFFFASSIWLWSPMANIFQGGWNSWNPQRNYWRPRLGK